MKLTLRASILAQLVVLPLLVQAAAAQNIDYRGNALHLPQGWTPDTRNRWHFISQGTALVPYEWFLALEQPGGGALLSSPANMQRLGFLIELADRDYNPDALPVGFDKVRIDFDEGKHGCWKGNWLGLGCAGCHTGQINYHGHQIRIEGGAGHIDTEHFAKQVGGSIADLAQNGAAFGRFAQRVASLVPTDLPTLQKSFACFAGALQAEKQFYDLVDPGNAKSVPAGFGRLDAHTQGLNVLLAVPFNEPSNYAPLTGPVRYSALWDTPYFDWVLYNASIRQPLARNIAEALGVQAPIKHDTMLQPNVVHRLSMENIVWGQRMLMDLQSPVWPERILGKIDAVKVLRGRQVYAMHCADCHRLIDRTTHAAPGDGRKSCSEIQIPMYDLNTVGTDPQQATTFEQRMISLAKLGVPQEIVSYKVVETVTGKIVTQWVGASPTNAALVDEIDCGRRGEFRAPLAYRARPLNGIWAMAPYLHNGSVPSLDALLLSAKDRPKKFYVGSWEFNPEIVGYETENDFPGDFTFDTTTLGNSNAGHEYGTDLDGEDRKALIEYLKTL